MRGLSQKLLTLQSRPRIALTGAVRELLLWLSDRWAEFQLQRLGYLGFLGARPPDALPPHFADLWFLYRIVRHLKPQCILEFGSGCSTVILARALLDNAKEKRQATGRLYSVDADQYWAEVTCRILPEDLLPLCAVVSSALDIVSVRGIQAYRHRTVPTVNPDFVYLDGPALSLDIRVAVDVLDLESRFRERCLIVVDGRWENTEFLLRYLRRPYRFKYDWLLNKSMFELDRVDSNLS